MLIGGSAAQANWLGPQVGGHLVPFYIHQVNSVYSCNGFAMMTAAQTLHFYYYYIIITKAIIKLTNKDDVHNL